MARATIHRQWGPDSALRVTFELEGSYPDAADQACAEAARLFTQALAIEETFDEADEAGD